MIAAATDDFEIMDAKQAQDIVKGMIETHGDGPEHHYHYYIDEEEQDYVPKCIRSPSLGYGILGLHDTEKDEWTFHAEPLCPIDERARFLHDVASFLFSGGAKKISVEIRPKTRDALLDIAKGAGVMRLCKVNYELDWPVYLMDRWTGDQLQGSTWKDLRYCINVFRKNSPSAKVLRPSEVPQHELLRLIRVWKQTRAKRREHTPTAFLENAVKNGFAGFDETRIVVVEGKPVAITAGFKVQHTVPQYYSAIGIYDQRLPRLGEFANWDDLCNLKRKGYTRVDFGGGDDSLNEFKRKFGPSLMYKTQIFSIKPLKPSKQSKSLKLMKQGER